MAVILPQVCYHWGRGTVPGGNGNGGNSGSSSHRSPGGKPVPGYQWQQHPWLRTAL